MYVGLDNDLPHPAQNEFGYNDHPDTKLKANFFPLRSLTVILINVVVMASSYFCIFSGYN